MLRRDPLRNPEALIEQVYRYVAARIGDGAHAEDITGAVFERAVRYRRRYDPAKGEPIAWLVGIARRCIADAHESPSVTLAGLRIDAPSADEVEEHSVRRLAMQEALARLSPRDRELIALRYGADLSARQIGELLNADAHAIETALSRAVARLRALLAEPAGERETSAL